MDLDNEFSDDPAELVRRLDDYDVRKGALLTMLINMEPEITERGWDQPSELMLVSGEWLDAENYALAATGLGPIPVAGGGGGGDYLAAFLRMSALNFVPRLRDRNTVAFVLHFEGWALVDVARGDEEAMRAGRAHVIASHPDRVECRVLLAADRDGSTYALSRRRGGPLSATVQVRPPDYDDGQVSQALRLMAAAL